MGRPKKNSTETAPASSGSNVSDDTLKEFLDKARKMRRLHEKAAKEAEPYKEAEKAALGEYRSFLKVAKKAGVSVEALTAVLAMEKQDRDVTIAEERQKIRLMALSGEFPSIQTDLFDGLDLAPPEGEEADKIAAERAYDEGVFAGSEGKLTRDGNKHVPGSEAYDAWDRGWLAGQKTLAEQLRPKGKKKHAKEPKPAAKTIDQAVTEIGAWRDGVEPMPELETEEVPFD
jgi:hypothetical protein